MHISALHCPVLSTLLISWNSNLLRFVWAPQVVSIGFSFIRWDYYQNIEQGDNTNYDDVTDRNIFEIYFLYSKSNLNKIELLQNLDFAQQVL